MTSVACTRTALEQGSRDYDDWLDGRWEPRLGRTAHALAPHEHAMMVGALHGESFAALCERMTLRVAEDQVSGYALGLLQKWLAQGLIAVLDA